MKFLLIVIYGSPPRHSNSYKTFMNNRNNFRYKLQTGLARPDRNALWRLISGKVWKLWTRYFEIIFILIFNFSYQNLESISLIVWKLCAFRQRSNFGNFKQFFHHNFQLKYKFWILMVSFWRSSSDLSEYTLFHT